MNVVIYALAALLIGVVVTYLFMRLRQEKHKHELLREHDRITASMNTVNEENSRLCEELAQVKDELERVEDSNRVLDNDKARLEAAFEAAQRDINKQASDFVLLQGKYNELQASLTDATAQYARLQAEYNALQEKLDARKSEMDELQKQMLLQFKTMASDIMDEKTRTFKEMSGENLKTILEPLNRDIEGFKKQVSQCYEVENRERATLQEQIKQLAVQNEMMRREADKLSSALRGGTKVQGDWGEMILLNILQQSGLREGEDFEIQKTVDAVGDNSRPDAILHFPNHSDLIIDSKVSFTAYDSYMNADSDEDRRRYARQHLDSVYIHIRELERRDYSSRTKQSPEFVIMFIPIESMFLLALDEARNQGKNLWNEAYQKRIIIMTPTNLVLAVRMLQDMWRQQRLESNIRAIKERAEKMYAQFASFASDIETVRQHLDAAVRSCDSASVRLKSGNDNLILQFEKMRSLGIEPKIPQKAQKNWKLLQNEAGVTDESDADATSIPSDSRAE